jgi:hypothetical protein
MGGSQKTESQAREGLIGGISDQKADHLSVQIGVVRDPLQTMLIKRLDAVGRRVTISPYLRDGYVQRDAIQPGEKSCALFVVAAE